MFTTAAITAVASYLGGDLLMLLAGKLLPSRGLGAAKALVKIMRTIEANGEHLPPGVRRQIEEDARAAGNEAQASLWGGKVRNGWGN